MTNIKRNILVSSPSMYQGLTFLPAIYGILKTSCDEYNKSLSEQLTWLDPLFTYSSTCEDALAYYKNQKIDILALSCYEWNWDFQLEFASLVKTQNPDCLVIMGGPQPDWNDATFFNKFLFVDVVVKGEPEDVFPQLIQFWLDNNKVPNDLLGVWTKDNTNQAGAKTVLRANSLPLKSPYNENVSVYLSALQNMDRNKNPHLWVTWETSRGCPYQCVFCDWGSSTFTKIREVDLARVKNEIQFFADLKIETVYITDANFGILERDVLITQLVADSKNKYGYPKTIFFNPAKNNPHRLVQIYKILHENKLLNYCIQNNLQSTQADVLKTMKRIDVGEEKQKEFINEIYKTGIHMGAALILGNPDETLNDFKKSIYDILRWGIHSEIRVFSWALLPNAPAANPNFIRKHAIEVVERPTMRNAVGRDVAKSKFSGKSKYLVSHSKLTKDDWIEANLFSTFMLTFHGMGITRFVSIFLNKTLGISFEQFYEELYSKVFKQKYKDLYDHLKKHYTNYLYQEDAIINLDFEPKLDIQIDPEAWLFLNIIIDKNKTSEILLSHINSHFNSEHAIDAMRFNIEMLIDPEYDPSLMRSFKCSYDWLTYFTLAEDPAMQSLGKPTKLEVQYFINQQGTGPYLEIPLNHTKGQLDAKLSSYNQRVVGQKSSRHLRTYFQTKYLEQKVLKSFDILNRNYDVTSALKY